MTNFEWTAAFVIACLSAARITRLVVWDEYPPVAHLRAWWDKHTDESDWNLLLHCGYCFGFWTATGVVGWGAVDYFLGDGLHPAWWVFNGLFAVAYVAAIVMAYDGEEL